MQKLLALVLVTSCAFDEAPDESSTTQELGPTLLLKEYWNASTQDYALSTNPSFAPSGYTAGRAIAKIFSPSAPQPQSTKPLYTWFSTARGDYMTTTNPYWAGGPGDAWNNYAFVRLEGYVYDKNVAGTMPMQMWWSGSRGDNKTTVDPRLTTDPTIIGDYAQSPDYGFARAEGFVLPPDGGYEPLSSVDHATMGGAPRGERTALVLHLEFSDAPFRHSRAQVEDLIFGPSFPNVRDYTSVASQGRFTWGRGSVVGPLPYVNDPDTTNDESKFHEMYEKGQSNKITLAQLKTDSGEEVAARSDSLVTSGRGNETQITFGLVDHNGGELRSGDLVSFKTINGKYLRDAGGSIRADVTSSSSSSARFTIITPLPGPITSETLVLLQNLGTARFLRENHTATEGDDEPLTSTLTAATENSFTLLKAFAPDQQRFAEMAVRQAALAGHDFRQYDVDHDNRIEPNELALMIFVSAALVTDANGDPIIFHDSASTRGLSEISIPNTSPPLVLAPMKAVAAGEDASFATLAHEMLHTLGTLDMRDHWATWYMTVMGSTIEGTLDNRWTYLLDPWHRIRLGWVEPDIRAVNTSGGVMKLATPALLSGKPLVLYDPSKFDVLGDGEYFILEFRTNQLAGYDSSVARATGADHGIAVWRYGQSGDVERIMDVQWDEVGDIDKLFNSGHGLVSLKYKDGTDSGIRIRVSPTTNTSTSAYVEWSLDGQIRPWISNGPVSGNANALATITGQFPINGVSYRLDRVSTGANYFPTSVSFSPESATIRMPSNVPPGSYMLYVINGSEHSNGHPITINP